MINENIMLPVQGKLSQFRTFLVFKPGYEALNIQFRPKVLGNPTKHRKM